MVLLGAVILPHGAMPYDGDLNSPSQAVRDRQATMDPAFKDTLTQLFNGICQAASTIAELQADLYIMHTPHGICLTDSYGIYGNTSAEGNGLWLGEWSEFTASSTLAQDRAKQFRELLNASSLSAQTITCYGGSEDVKMRWGEAIPMWYIQKYVGTETTFMLMSQDTMPRTGVIDDFRLDVGKTLAEFVEGLSEKVVVVISADLSHVHPTDVTDPLYLPAPGSGLVPNKEAADAYDAAVAEWILAGAPDIWDPVAAMPYLVDAVGLEPTALSCGMKGFVMLHGFLADYVDRGATFKPQLWARSAPTYYGMLAATFIKN